MKKLIVPSQISSFTLKKQSNGRQQHAFYLLPAAANYIQHERNGGETWTHLGLLVDDEGSAAHDVAAVPHLALAGADLLGVLHL